MKKIHWDVIVIGAGVAGSIAAREMARSGHRVLLVDKRGFPRRKVCGACLNSAALKILDHLGLGTLVDSLGARPLNRFVLQSGSQSTSLPLPGGRSLSREALDAALVSAAIAAGVDFLPEASASLGKSASTGVEVRLTHSGNDMVANAKAVIVAAGLQGVTTADTAKWTTQVSRRSRIGTGCTIEDLSHDFSSGTIWMAAGRDGYVGLVRIEDGRLNVAAAVDRDSLRTSGSAAESARRVLASAGFCVPRGLASAEWQGTVPLTRSTSPVANHRTFLIGDAAGYVEPFTGEGMTWGMLSGQLVVPWVQQAIRSNPCSEAASAGWCREYRVRIKNRQRFCRFATGLVRSPLLMRWGMETLSVWPGLAKFLVNRMQGTASDQVFPLEAG